MKRLTRSVATVVLAGVTTFMLPATSSHAAFACEPPLEQLVAGRKVSSFSSTVFGSRSKIEYNNPDLCGNETTGGSFSSAWTMVVAFSDDPNYFGWEYAGYAQAGYIQAANGGTYETGILEWGQFSRKCVNTGSCTGLTFKNVYGDALESPPSGASQTYAVVLNSSDNRVHMYAGGRDLGRTGYNPAGNWDSAWQAQYYGEVIHWESDVPGTLADKTNFQENKYYKSDGSTAFANLAGCYTTISRHHCATYSPSGGGDGLRIWTNPLNGY